MVFLLSFRHQKVRYTSSNVETSTTTAASSASKEKLRKTVSFKPSTEVEPSFDEGDEELNSTDCAIDNKTRDSNFGAGGEINGGVAQGELPDQQQLSPITTTSSSSPSRSSSLMSPKRRVLIFFFIRILHE